MASVGAARRSFWWRRLVPLRARCAAFSGCCCFAWHTAFLQRGTLLLLSSSSSLHHELKNLEAAHGDTCSGAGPVVSSRPCQRSDLDLVQSHAMKCDLQQSAAITPCSEPVAALNSHLTSFFLSERGRRTYYLRSLSFCKVFADLGTTKWFGGVDMDTASYQHKIPQGFGVHFCEMLVSSECFHVSTAWTASCST